MSNSPKKSAAIGKLESRIVEAAMGYPEVIEDTPWGHRAFKIRGKMFVVLSTNHGLSVSVKLPHSGLIALNFPNVEPTGYGMGKSGWVTISFTQGDELPFALLLEWIEESFRTIAPKKVVAQYAELTTTHRADEAAPTIPRGKTPMTQRRVEATPTVGRSKTHAQRQKPKATAPIAAKSARTTRSNSQKSPANTASKARSTRQR